MQMSKGPEFPVDPNTNPEDDFTGQGFSDWLGKIKHERPDIFISAVLNSLKPYPLLTSIVLDTMTDEEFEQYVDSLPDEPEDSYPTSSTSSPLGLTLMKQQVDQEGFHVDILKTGENVTALVNEFPGISLTGQTGDEALLNINEAISLHQQNLKGIIAEQERQ